MSMVKYIGVRFKKVGKIYYFSPGDLQIPLGSKVIVETVRGVECGEVVLVDKEMEEKKLSAPLKSVIRIADHNDMETIERNKQKERKPLPYVRKRYKSTGSKWIWWTLNVRLTTINCCFILPRRAALTSASW